MKMIPKAVIVNNPQFEHGDVIEFVKPLGSGVVGEVGIVAKNLDSDWFKAYLVATKEYVRVRHDDRRIRFVGHVTKTDFAAA